jgi:GDP-L-fucose synthase
MAPIELPFRIEGRRIWVAGHRGMVGSALMRRLAREDCELVTVDRRRVDLCRQAEVQAWMHETKPDVVILAAARVGASRRTPAVRPTSSMKISPCRLT